VDPLVGHVGSRHGVAEPLVRALVDDDEVELHADADAGPVALEVAVREAIAVGHGALVLHAGVGRLDQLVAVLAERVLAKVLLEGLDHRLRLRELLLRLVETLRKDPEVQRLAVGRVGEMRVVSDVQRHAVVVDRVLHVPVPARVAVAQVGLPDELPVRHVHQVTRDGDADAHLLHLVLVLVLVRPPHAGADVLAGGVDPVPAGRVLPEGDAAEAAALRRVAGVVEVDRVHLAAAQRLGEVHEYRALFALELQRDRSLDDPVDLQRRREVQLDSRVVLQHPEADRVLPADRLLLRIHPDIEVVGQQVVVDPVLPLSAAQDVRLRRLAPWRRERPRGDRPHQVLLRRLEVHEPLHEEVPAPAHHVRGRVAEPVVLVREHQEIEILVRLDQRAGHHQRLVGRHVGVHRAVRQEQAALQILRVELVRLGLVTVRAVGIAHDQALVALAPVVLVQPLVVVPRLGDARLEEVGEAEHRGGRGEAAARVPPDARAPDVEPRVLRRQLLHPRNLVRDRVVAAHRPVVSILERLRAARCAHPVDGDDDEAELGQGLAVAARGGEGAAPGAAGLRTGVDVVDDGILAVWIEPRGPEHQAVDVRRPVARLHPDRYGRLPARCLQPRDVGRLDHHHEPALAIAQGRGGRDVGLRVRVHHVPA